MGKNNKNIPFWAQIGHAKPVTRRDFLATGIIPFSAWAVGPSIATLLLQEEARAAGCDTVGSAMIPFITVNLAGGPSMASQLAVKNLSGNYLGSYTKVGLGGGPTRSFNVLNDLGAEFAGTPIGGNVTGLVSKFLMGMRSPAVNNINTAATTPGPRPAALDKTQLLTLPVANQDDSSNNPFDVTGAVVKMGLQGSKLPNLGTADTLTGLSQRAAIVPPPAPFIVSNVDSLAAALGYTTTLRSSDGSNSTISLSANQRTSLARLISNLSGSQTRKLASVPGASSLQQMLECIGVRNSELVKTGGGDVNPYTGSAQANQLATIWQVNVNDRTSRNAIFGALVYNGLVGNAATINLNLGGYDYHNNTRTTGDTMDFGAGQIVGKILQTAELVGKPCFVYVCADGATGSAEDATADSVWTGDRGVGGVLLMLAYSPAGRPAIGADPSAGATPAYQIGGFNEGQGADSNFPTGNQPELAAAAVFSNYAAWNKQNAFLEKNRIAGDAVIRSKVIRLRG